MGDVRPVDNASRAGSGSPNGDYPLPHFSSRVGIVPVGDMDMPERLHHLTNYNRKLRNVRRDKVSERLFRVADCLYCILLWQYENKWGNKSYARDMHPFREHRIDVLEWLHTCGLILSPENPIIKSTQALEAYVELMELDYMEEFAYDQHFDAMNRL